MKLTAVRVVGIKDGYEYSEDSFGTLFGKEIDQSNKVGGQDEDGRNRANNAARISRIKAINPSMPVVDYGCGSGLFVEDARNAGIECHGYDPFNPEFSKVLTPNNYGLVIMTEVVEHLSEPFSEFDDIKNLLVDGGYFMVESSFSDFISIKDDYASPALGHSTIWSHSGLDAAMVSLGFKVERPLNRNVRLYRKLR